MGIDMQRPLVAGNDTTISHETAIAEPTNSPSSDLATYVLPDDGTPITISTSKLHPIKDGSSADGKLASQTSLLIEYFEAGKTGDKLRNKPSVRVRVTPSNHRKHRTRSDAVQITGIGEDKRPSYTQRISLGNKTDRATIRANIDPADSRSSGSARSYDHRPPVEVELLDPSDMSGSRTSRDITASILSPHHNPSAISSMPPDSLLASPQTAGQSQPRPTQAGHLEAPKPRTRSLSQERIAQKVMQRLASSGLGKPIQYSYSGVEYEPDNKPKMQRRRRSSRHAAETSEDVASLDSSQLSSQFTHSQTSYRSANSKVSLNNPKLLQVVEDTVRRIILPELHQLRREGKINDHDNRATSASSVWRHAENEEATVSKSPSTLEIRTKPKVVLTESDNDNPGQLLSRGDSERRPSARYAATVEAADDHHTRNVATGLTAGGLAAAAALHRHNSREPAVLEKPSKAKSATSSRRTSSSTSSPRRTNRPTASFEAGSISETTRKSIASTDSEQTGSVKSQQSRPYHISESIQKPMAPQPYVPHADVPDIGYKPQTAIGKTVSRQSDRSSTSERSERSSKPQDHPLVPAALRTKSSDGSRSSKVPSPHSTPDPRRSGVPHLSQDLSSYDGSSVDEYVSESNERTLHEPYPKDDSDDIDAWFKAQHEQNEQHRASLIDASAHDNATKFTQPSVNMVDTQRSTIKSPASVPQYRRRSPEVESNVASLLEPSQSSGATPSDLDSATAGLDNRTQTQAQTLGPRFSHEKATWSAIHAHAREASEQSILTAGTLPVSPRHSEDIFSRASNQDVSIKLGANALPLPHDPLPEVGHGFRDDDSDVITNPPSIQGPISASPLKHHSPDGSRVLSEGQPTSQLPGAVRTDRHIRSHEAQSPLHSATPNTDPRRFTGVSTVPSGTIEEIYHDERSLTPTQTNSSQHISRDYTPGFFVPSSASLPSQSERLRSNRRFKTELSPSELAEYEAMMGAADSIRGSKTFRHLSTSSTNLGSSPFFNTTTSKGMDAIQSKDVIALLDHLTVRDAERHARDTELLVTLVRSATEMRSQFEEMKQFIHEQDQKIMRHTDEDASWTVKKVIDTPRVQVPASVPFQRTDFHGETPSDKRKNIFSRALKGIGGKSKADNERIEGMLMRVLDNLENLKDGQNISQQHTPWDLPDHNDECSHSPPVGYMDPKAVPAVGRQSHNEHDRSGSVTPTQHDLFPPTKNERTVLGNVVPNGLNSHPHPRHMSQEPPMAEDTSMVYTIPRKAVSQPEIVEPYPAQVQGRPMELTAEELEKHKSHQSSLVTTGPALSRWSKTTTASSAAHDNQGQERGLGDGNPGSQSSLEHYQPLVEDHNSALSASNCSVNDDTSSARSAPSNRSSGRNRRQQERAGSPLLPSESKHSPAAAIRVAHRETSKSPALSAKSSKSSISHASSATPSIVSRRSDGDTEIDGTLMQDPKYRSNRNSLPLAHPQPRAGHTSRHQNNLESQARQFTGSYDNGSELSTTSTASASSDGLTWGGLPAMSLAKANHLTRMANHNAYTSSTSPKSSQQSGLRASNPQVPRYTPEPIIQPPRQEPDHYDNSLPVQTFSNMYYQSPLGTGHLLEPIEEVRYSLETDVS